jgi:drug/metabolite transporter (DMT)-like permease
VRTQRLGTAAMVGATLLWGSTFVLIRDTVKVVPPAALMLIRFAPASLLFAALIAVRHVLSPRPFDRRALWTGLVCSPFICTCLLLQARGLRETSAGSSAFLTCAGTLAAPLFAWALLRQRPTARLSLAMALALLGSALLSLRDGLRFGGPEALTLLGSVAYAFQIVLVARVAETVDTLVLAGAQALGVALCLLPLTANLQPAAIADAASGVKWTIAWLALAGSFAAPLLQVLAQRTLSSARVALLFALEPLFALAFAVTVGGERFVALWWSGAALILSAVWVAESTPRKS